MLELVQQQGSGLKMADPSFKIELAVLQAIAGKQAEDRSIYKLNQLLPGKDKRCDIAWSIAEVEKVVNAEAQSLAPWHVQQSCKLLLATLRSIEAGTCPDVLPCSSSPMLRSLFLRVGYFCTTKGPKNEDLFGAEAMRHTVGLLKAKSDKNALKADDVKPLVTFAWLIDVKDEAVANTMRCSAQEQSGAAAKKAAASKMKAAKPTGSKAASSSSSQPARADLVCAEVNDMFA